MANELSDLPTVGPLLGLDLGTKTIGLAVSNSMQSVATSLPVIKRKKFLKDAEKLHEVILTKQIKGLVFGLPLNMDGSEGPRAQATRAFARNLHNIVGIELPVGYWDERLSTVAVERDMIDVFDTTRAKRAELIDSAAASFILQGAIDALQHDPHAWREEELY